jgi:multisubunit Na+/H+ antiporter MnhB subunit
MMSIRNIAAIVFFCVVAVFFVISALMIHPFGHPEEQYDEETGKFVIKEPEMDQYIINNCQNETGADNGVTSVVFDYRGFDTLGEATVLFTAVAGVILLFRRLKK